MIVEKYYEPLDIYSIEEFDTTFTIDPAQKLKKIEFIRGSSTAYVKINAYNLVEDDSSTII